MTRLDDAGYVEAQYRDAARLAARVSVRTSARATSGARLAYVRSIQNAAVPASESSLMRFAGHVEREIARSGALHVGIAGGLVTGVRL